MAAVSNYSLRRRGPQWLIYSEALGGAVRRRTPSLPLCWLTVLDSSQFKILNTALVSMGGGVFLYTIQDFVLADCFRKGSHFEVLLIFEVSAIKHSHCLAVFLSAIDI